MTARKKQPKTALAWAMMNKDGELRWAVIGWRRASLLRDFAGRTDTRGPTRVRITLVPPRQRTRRKAKKL